MPFSAETKDELARVGGALCCQKAELLALLRYSGRFISGERFLLTTENAAAARKVVKGLKNILSLPVKVAVRRQLRLKKNNEYLVFVEDGMSLRQALKRNLLPARFEAPATLQSKEMLQRNCCQRAYLRGAFLSKGSVSSPQGAYHLEIFVADREHAHDLESLLQELGIEGRCVGRKRGWVVYLKDGERVAGVLSLMGAHVALLQFENARIYKGMRNQVNRLVNCDTANVNKMVLAGVRQEENIRFVVDNLGLQALPPALREMAQLRLNNPEISLKELGELAQPALSKSCVNHRLRKLEQLAAKLRAEEKHK